MKRITAVLLLFCMILMVKLPTDAAPPIPSLFCNDEPWYKDTISPLIEHKDIYHVPTEIFSMIDNISVTFPTNDNLLIHNTVSDRYISILLSKSKAIVNGILCDISVFKEGSVYYADAEAICSAIGICQEYDDSIGNTRRMRFYYDAEAINFTFEELLAPYKENEETKTEEPPQGENTAETKKQFFLLCGSGKDPNGTPVPYAAVDALQKSKLNYSVFLEGNPSERAILEAYTNGGWGILPPSIYLKADTALEYLKKHNDAASIFTNRYTHYTLSTESETLNKNMENAGYVPITPDFHVTGNSVADTVLKNIHRHFETNDYCIIYLEDCWNTDYLARQIANLDSTKYVTANISVVPN